MPQILLSIDIGTLSIRCALISAKGKILALDKETLWVHRTAITHEYNSDNIWQCLALCIKRLIAAKGILDRCGAAYTSILTSNDSKRVEPEQISKRISFVSGTSSNYVASMIISGTITASVAAGLYDSLESAVSETGRYEKRLKPNN